jgi:NTE family protein
MSFILKLKRMLGNGRRLGLVLGSGGARGLAHIGVLRVLEEAGIPLHCVVGASAGAMVGGLYAGGTSPAKIEEVFGEFSLKGLARILLPTMGQGGIIDGRRIEKLMEPHASGKLIEDLPLKFACVATDISTGEKIVFKKGDLMEGIRASISIPGLLTPVVSGGRILVDGGVVDPLPIKLAFELGATFAIVVQVGRRYSHQPAPNGDSENDEKSAVVGSEKVVIPSATEVLLSALSIYDYRLSELSLQDVDDHILVRPSLPGIEILDFHKGHQAIAAGENAMRARLPDIDRGFFK